MLARSRFWRRFGPLLRVSDHRSSQACGCSRNAPLKPQKPSFVEFSPTLAKEPNVAKYSLDQQGINDEEDEGISGDFGQSRLLDVFSKVMASSKGHDRSDLDPSSSPSFARFQALVEAQPHNRNRWLKVVKERPALLRHQKPEDLVAFIDHLTAPLGLSKRQSFDLLTVVPLDLLGDTEGLGHSLSSWMALCDRYKVTAALEVLSRVPEVLYLDPRVWMERISHLSQYFNLKRHLKDLLANNAEVLTMPLGEYQDKMDYMVRVMHVNPEDICKSKALASDLRRIQVRYIFLERSGLYSHPTYKDVGSSRSASPLIDRITDTSDEEFMEEVVGHGFTVDDMEALRRTLSEEELFMGLRDKDEFELVSEENRQYSSQGYHGPHVREDIEEACRLDKGFDR